MRKEQGRTIGQDGRKGAARIGNIVAFAGRTTQASAKMLAPGSLKKIV
jgi:hypothetical protein